MAALQLALEPSDNLARIADEVAAIRRRLPWVRMVVLGELGVFGPNPALAQPLPGPAEQFLCDVARKNRLWLIPGRSEENTSELQALMRNSYSVFCWKKKKKTKNRSYSS